MAYAQITYADFVAAISTRLNDPTNRFWRLEEVQGYALEALQTYQAFSAFYSSAVNFTTTAGVFLYNLQEEIAELEPTITDRDLIVQIQRHLQEPESATSWTGSEQFTYVQVVAAIQRRRDKFIVETGISQKITDVSVLAGTTNVTLDDDTIDVVRAVWEDEDGLFTVMTPTDPFALTAVSPSWNTDQDTSPTDYAKVMKSPLTLQISPAPSANGTLHLLTVNSGDDLDPSNNATILDVPDDLAWVIKFGALADLFGQDGPGKDSERAEYCEQRWKEGSALARIYNTVRLAYIGGDTGTPSFLDALFELDMFQPDWMNSTQGSTDNLVLSGTILGVNPPPGVVSIGLDVLPKMPLPSADGDFIQVGKEVVDALVDYAQHLAMLKEGTMELQATVEQYKNLVRIAAVTNDRLRANASNFDALSDKTLRQYKEDPRRKSDITKSELDYKQDAV